MMTSKVDIIKNLGSLLRDIHSRTQTPISTSELWKGEKTKSRFTDNEVGKNYPLERFVELGILKIVGKAKRSRLVIWNTRYPDEAMCEALYKLRSRNRTPKQKEKAAKHKLVKAETNQDDVLGETLTPVETIIDYLRPEFEVFGPDAKTVPNVSEMLRVSKHNATDRYCHKDLIFCLQDKNENGDIVNVSYRTGHQYSYKKLVKLGVFERNPKNKSLYKFVAEYDDLTVFAKKLAFAINYLGNKPYYENLRQIRLEAERLEAEKAELLKKEEAPALVETVETVAYLVPQEEVKEETPVATTANDISLKILGEIRLQNEKLSERYDSINALYEKAHNENQENLKLLRKAIAKLVEATLKIKNNGMSNEN